jgi:two-component system, cell cycle response regulator
MASNLVTVNSSPTVLLASANDRIVEALGSTLESWHYQIDLARNGADTLARLDGPVPPAIALIDMDLPYAGASEVIWEIRRRHEQRRTWCILFGDNRDPAHIREALQCGADDFLALPADLADSAELRIRIRVAERVSALSSRIHKQSAELRYLTTHDGLTGLWNREALVSLIFQETDRVQRMKTPLTLMLLDLDDFSRINHDFGYETGDRILIEIANRFRRHLRSYDLIGRCGEDEFLLALPGCTVESALELANRVRELILGSPFPTDSESTTLTASIGVATSRGRSPLVVLREAEHALAEAKISGKNCVRSDSPEAWIAQPALSAG